MKRLTVTFFLIPLLVSCGTVQVKDRPTVPPLAGEESLERTKTEKLIQKSLKRPDWSSSPRVIYAKPVWIPPVIRKIYIPPHEAPDGSMVAGYYVWKKVLPSRWRKPGEDAGRIPLQAAPQSRDEDRVSPQDAEAILNFLKRFKRSER